MSLDVGKLEMYEYRFVRPDWDGDEYGPQDWQEITNPAMVEWVAQNISELADARVGNNEECRRTAERTKLVKVRIR